MARRTDITVDSLLQDLQDDRDLARRLEQPSAAIAATQLAAKLCGLLVDRKESGQPGDFATLATPEEVMAFVAKELGAEAAQALAIAIGKRETEQAQAPSLDATPTDGPLN